MSILVLGLILFLGVHSLRIFAGDWRQAQIARVGEQTWKGVYSLVSAIALGLIILGYGMARVDSPVLWSAPVWTRHLTALLTLPAFILLVAAYLPGTHIKAAVGHPMVAGVKIWALAHLLTNSKLSAVTLFAAFLIWAVLDFISCRRRDRAQNIQYAAANTGATVITVVAGVVVAGVFAMWLHGMLIGVKPFG